MNTNNTYKKSQDNFEYETTLPSKEDYLMHPSAKFGYSNQSSSFNNGIKDKIDLILGEESVLDSIRNVARANKNNKNSFFSNILQYVNEDKKFLVTFEPYHIEENIIKGTQTQKYHLLTKIGDGNFIKDHYNMLLVLYVKEKTPEETIKHIVH